MSDLLMTRGEGGVVNLGIAKFYVLEKKQILVSPYFKHLFCHFIPQQVGEG